MQQLSLIDKIIYQVLRGFLAVLGILPNFMISCLAETILFLGQFVAKKEISNLRINIKEILKLPQESHFAKMFEKQVFRHQVYAMIESMIATQNPGRLKIHNETNLKQQLDANAAHNRGQIICTAHIGSWEQVAAVVARNLATPFYVLAKPSGNKGVTKFLNDIRMDMNVKVLWTDRSSIFKDMFKNIKSNGAIGFVMDQKPENRKGPVVTFFDRETEFVAGPASIAVKTGCAVIAVNVLRISAFQYRVVSHTLHEAEHGIQDVDYMTQTMASSIEALIKQYPEQWCWNYKRWKFGNYSVQSGECP